MENEMLNKILEEINKVNNKVDSLQIEMNKRFEEMDKKFERKFEVLNNKFEGLNNKFEGLNNKFEGLNFEVKEIKKELKQLRKDFERHDRGEKMAWQEFENNIGEEIERLDDKIEGNTLQLLYVKNAVRSLVNIHKKELKLAEEIEKYESDTNQE